MVSQKECAFEGCDKPSRFINLCRGHYTQQYNGKELRPLIVYTFQESKLCPTCDTVKGRDGYYIKKKSGRLQTECKECMKVRARRNLKARQSEGTDE